jgi:aminopeptidase N
MIAKIAGFVGTVSLLAGGSGGELRGQCADQVELGIRTVRYEMALRIDYQQEKLGGQVRLTLENHSAQPVTRVPFLLYRLMEIGSISDGDRTNLEFEQKVVGFQDWPQLQVNFVEVTLARPLKPGEQRTLEIQYSGYLLGYAETGMRYVQDRIDPDFTIIRPDAFSYPEMGVPCIGAMRRMGLSTFDYLVSVTVPDSLRVVNGGELVDVKQDGGSVTFTYRNTRPAWRMDFAVANYGMLAAGANRVFFLPGDSAGAVQVLEALKDALTLFEEWFGPLARPQGLSVIEIPDGWGSQKDETTIIQAAAAFRDPGRAREVYHEVSHFWNVPSLDRPSPRWNEGLASFLEYQALGKIEGRLVVEDRFASVRNWLVDAVERRPELSNTALIGYGHQQLTDYSYSVGMLFFALLHELVGQEAFNRIIGGFYREYQAVGATTDQFADYVRAVATPGQGKLIEDWLYTTGWTAVIRDHGTLSGVAALYRER